MDANFIVSPIVGGAIGGLANWLAIQMLFFPLHEKRILGIKIPFTPGLIPKERKRIAASIADAVSNYFLSEEVIVNAVISPKAEDQIRVYIEELVENKKDSQDTIEQVFRAFTGKEYDDFAKDFENKIVGIISDSIDSPIMIDAITASICNDIDKFLDKDINDLSNDEFNRIKEIFVNKTFSALNSKTFKTFITYAASSGVNKLLKSKKKIKEIVPKEGIDYIKVKAVVNSDKIAEAVIEFITSSTVQFRMRKHLKNSFENSFKLRMISKVVDVEKIFENLFVEIIDFLENPENHKEIGNHIVKLIDSIADKKIKDVIEDNGPFNSKNIINKYLDNFVTEENIKSIVSTLFTENDQIMTFREMINTIDPNLLNNKEEMVKNAIILLFNSISIDNMVTEVVKNCMYQIGQMKLNRVLSYVSDDDVKFAQDAFIASFRKFVKGQSDRIVKVLDISKIVEDRINAFDIGEMEEIMLGVIKKDIWVMRAFEAGIGFIIGFIIPLYPYIINGLKGLFI